MDIIFLHANGFNARTYRQALLPLASEIRILAVDMRGHGQNSLPARIDGRGWQTYADDLLALIAAMGERPRVVAGHSMGGATALLAAAGLAGVRLVLFDPVVLPREIYAAKKGLDYNQAFAAGALRRKGYFPDRAAARAAYHGRGAFSAWPDAVLDDYLEDGLRPVPGGGFALTCAPPWEAANFAGFGICDPHRGLTRGLDIHILRAEFDSTCSLPESGDGYRMEVVRGTTHFLPMERPDVVQAALREAVQER